MQVKVLIDHAKYLLVQGKVACGIVRLSGNHIKNFDLEGYMGTFETLWRNAVSQKVVTVYMP